MICLASPYSHKRREVRVRRYVAACRAAAAMISAGHKVFSPIAHSHPIAECGVDPMAHHIWMPIDEAILEACSEVAILASLPGWDKSRGVKAEVAQAIKQDKPVLRWHYRRGICLPFAEAWEYEDRMGATAISDGMFVASRVIDGVRMYPYQEFVLAKNVTAKVYLHHTDYFVTATVRRKLDLMMGRTL